MTAPTSVCARVTRSRRVLAFVFAWIALAAGFPARPAWAGLSERQQQYVVKCFQHLQESITPGGTTEADRNQEAMCIAGLLITQAIDSGKFVVSEDDGGDRPLSDGAKAVLKGFADQALTQVRKDERRAQSNNQAKIEAKPVQAGLEPIGTPAVIDMSSRQLIPLNLVWKSHPKWLAPIVVKIASDNDIPPVALARALRDQGVLVPVRAVQQLAAQIEAGKGRNLGARLRYVHANLQDVLGVVLSAGLIVALAAGITLAYGSSRQGDPVAVVQRANARADQAATKARDQAAAEAKARQQAYACASSSYSYAPSYSSPARTSSGPVRASVPVEERVYA